MINNIREIKELLDEKYIGKLLTYRDILLLVCYYRDLNYTQKETVTKIFDYKNNHKHMVTDNIISIVNRGYGYKDSFELVYEKDVSIKVYESEIKYIVNNFKKKNTRLLAFAFLMLFSFYDKKELFVSISGISKWIKIARTLVYGRNYLNELYNHGFIEKITNDEFHDKKIKEHHKNKKVAYGYLKTYISKVNMFKIQDIEKSGKEFVFKDIDIRKEFNEIVSQIQKK